MLDQELPISLFRTEQAKRLDAHAINSGIPGYTLMNRAGEALFAALQKHWPDCKRVLIVCGAGNNAGDGYVLARLCHERGMHVNLAWLMNPDELRGDALTAAQDAISIGVPSAAFKSTMLEDIDMLVDALLGTGLDRMLEGAYADTVNAMNNSGLPVLSADIPSGLNADTGAIMGCAIRAVVTVSFIGLKQGLCTGSGPNCVGTLEYSDLQVPVSTFDTESPCSMRITQAILPRVLSERHKGMHKGEAGHVLVIGGDHGMSGAVRVAAEAAARSGAGLISVATRTEHALAQAAARPELMFRGVETAAELAPLLEGADVIAIGPGLGSGSWGRAMLDAVLQTNKPIVLDADGLNLLAGRPVKRENWIFTPHPGEAARLLDTDIVSVEADRFAAVEAIAEQFGGVALLKGAGTLVKAPDEVVHINTSGNPGMASGGMGDALTGVIAALVAQDLSLSDAACAGAFIHGCAADRASQSGQRGMLASDLFPHIRKLVNP